MDAARRAILMAPAVALAVALGGCGGAGSRAGGGDDGREAATRFLGALRAGQLAPAWEGTTSEFKSMMGLENLRDFVKAHPALKGPAEHVGARDATREGGPRQVEHAFRAETKVRGKPVATTIKVLVAPAESGGWAVEHVGAE